MLNWIVLNRTDYLHKMDLALNNLQRLICHQTQQTKPQLKWNYVYMWYFPTEQRENRTKDCNKKKLQWNRKSPNTQNVLRLFYNLWYFYSLFFFVFVFVFFLGGGAGSLFHLNTLLSIVISPHFDGRSLESGLERVSTYLQVSSQYSDRYQHCCSLSGFDSSPDFQLH